MNRKFAQPYDALALHHEKEHGIGLENINDRLRIFSRSDDRLVLRSRRGRYTSMFIYWASKSEDRCGSLCLWVDSSKANKPEEG